MMGGRMGGGGMMGGGGRRMGGGGMMPGALLGELFFISHQRARRLPACLPLCCLAGMTSQARLTLRAWRYCDTGCFASLYNLCRTCSVKAAMSSQVAKHTPRVLVAKPPSTCGLCQLQTPFLFPKSRPSRACKASRAEIAVRIRELALSMIKCCRGGIA